MTCLQLSHGLMGCTGLITLGQYYAHAMHVTNDECMHMYSKCLWSNDAQNE